MSQQIQITGGAKVRDLNDVIIGTSGVLSSLAFNVSNGVPKLDVNGKILVSQLPNSVMEYLGTWDASTNTPTLVNGTGNAGDVYLCNVAGTVNFGAGAISFVVSDQVIYSGTIWQKASGSNGTVTSVAASITGDSLGITGSPITTAGTLAFAYAGTNLQYVNGAGNLTTFPTLISSIGLSMPSAFSVSNSPLTANGTIAVAGAGSTAQYIRGDGTLATFPAVGGGGGGISFYLNGGTSQGTISGQTYYQMSPNAVIDTGVDFSTSVNGVVGYFLTDVSSPNQLKIPAGNWNFELYFSASSNGGSPNFYVEVFKYNSGVFTLLGSNVANPEGITNGTAIDLYVTAVAIPTTTLIVSDRIALRITVSTSGRTITLHTQGTHLCEVLTTFPSGISALNGLTIGTQYLVTGTSGSDFNIASVLDTHTFNIPDAGASARGVMTTGTQTIAGAKTFSGNLTANSFIKIGGGNLEFLKADGSVDSTAYVQSVTATSPLVRTGATNTPILSIPAATSSVNGYLTSTDWTTFNNKTSASGTASQIAYFTGANSLASDSFLWWDASLNRIGIGDFSTITPPAALSMISTIGAWYNRNTANVGNYSEIGLYYDATNGHLIQSNKVGTTDYSRISFINNAQTSLVLAEDYTVGINTRTPIPNISGVGGQGLDIYGGSVAASLAFHNVATGSTITDGSRLYITTAKHLLLRNLEIANVYIAADDGDVYIQAGGFDRITALSTGNVGIMNPATIPEALTVSGSIQQSGITSTMVKVNSSGKFIAAVLNTDYGLGTVTSVTGTAPVVSSGGTTPAISMAAATASVNGYLTSTDWNTFNNKFTLPSLISGSVLFYDGATIGQDNSAFFWGNVSKTLKITSSTSGTAAPYALHVVGTNSVIMAENPNATGVVAIRMILNGFTQTSLSYASTTSQTLLSSNYGSLRLEASSGNGVTFATTGAATFDSSATINDQLIVGTSAYSNKWNAKFGTILIQSYSGNNAWLSDNVYYNGTSFVRVADGYTGMLYFLGNEAQFRFGATGAAGGSIGDGVVALKTNLDGSFAVGNLSTASGNYTGATFKIASTGAATFSGAIAANSTITLGTTSVSGVLYINGAAATGGAFNFQENSVSKGWIGDSNYIGGTANQIVMYGMAGFGVELRTNNTTALTINTSQGATFSSTLQVGSSTTMLDQLFFGASGANGNITWDASYTYLLGGTSKGLSFGTNASANNRMVITSGGNVLIGTTIGSTTRLFIKGSDATGSNNALYIQNSTPADLFIVQNDGVIYTGTLASSPYNNAQTGRAAIIASSGILGYLVSTRESKANIESIKSIDFINQLNPVQFNYRKKDTYTNEFTDELYDNITYGFIADEVEKVNKELVFYNEDGTLAGVEYNSMIAILMKAVQEQNKIITSLNDRINKLENK